MLPEQDRQDDVATAIARELAWVDARLSSSSAHDDWQVALRLGRVSNLPTVWTNTLAGIVLAGGALAEPGPLPLLVALSLFYVGGMYLNDAFDAEIDALERPERPIPSGQVSAATVFAAGFGMLAAGVAAAALDRLRRRRRHRPLARCSAAWRWRGAIVLYNRRHKDNPLSPVLMGLCRVLVYLAAGLAVAVPLPAIAVARRAAAALLPDRPDLRRQAGEPRRGPQPVAAAVPGGAGDLCARPGSGQPDRRRCCSRCSRSGSASRSGSCRRRRPGDVPRAVVSLIAGIALLDAVLIAAAGAPGVAWLAVAGFVLTLALQRLVPGT